MCGWPLVGTEAFLSETIPGAHKGAVLVRHRLHAPAWDPPRRWAWRVGAQAQEAQPDLGLNPSFPTYFLGGFKPFPFSL